MFLGIDWTQWLPAITAALIALTVLVGIRGLYQDHTKDGKLTRAGWGIVAAMVVLGILTFLSGLLDQRIAEQKELAEAAEREEKFQRQMASLRGVTGSLSQLQTDMRGSLAEQQRLSGFATRNLQMSESLQRQAQANTLSVLRRVFQESNRVAAERIAVSVETRCTVGDEDQGIVIPEQVSLTIANGVGSLVTLATNQKLELDRGMMFHGFLGDLGNLETFAAWRSARISFKIFARRPLGRPMTIEEAIESSRRFERRGGTAPQPPDCHAAIMFLLNGRTVLRGTARFEVGPDLFHVAELRNLRIDPSRLPQFAPRREPR